MTRDHHRTSIATLLCGIIALFTSGCVSMATDRLAANLSGAMLNQTDPEIVRHGAPAYLLLLDSFIAESPEDKDLLYAGARLYGAYAGGLVTDPERRKNLTQKAMDYAALPRPQRFLHRKTFPRRFY